MGVGKSATSRALGKRLGWPIVDKDDASDVLMNHLEAYGFTAYEVMFSQAGSLLEQGFNVIVDSPLRSEAGFKNAVNLAKEAKAEVRVLECFCSDQSEWRRRLETRQRRPAHILKTWQDFEAYWEKASEDFDYPIDYPHLKLDTLNKLELNIDKIVKWLNS